MTTLLHDIESTPIELLDFEPEVPCDFMMHDQIAQVNEPVKWVITFHVPWPCGCKTAGPAMWCTPCLRAIQKARWRLILSCATCNHTIFWLSRYIKRVDPIR